VVVDGKQNLRPGAKVREANATVAGDGGKTHGKNDGDAAVPKGQP